MQRKIGSLRLSGLIVGPVLGSGIILLPPLAYQELHAGAIYAWGAIMLLGLVFGYAFTQLSLASPGNEGVALAIGSTLGPFWKALASNAVISAVCFGPVAVMMTAAGFLQRQFPQLPLDSPIWAMVLLTLSVGILLQGIQAISTVTLILSTATALILMVGSIHTLIFSGSIQLPQESISGSSLLHTVLLLFWAIIGWEILGNYVEDVENPKKTILRAMGISMVLITSTYMLTALALQSVSSAHGAASSISVVEILIPLLGNFAVPTITFIATGLCVATFLMIVGGVSRLIQAQAKQGILPKALAYPQNSPVPSGALWILLGWYGFQLILIHFQIFSLKDLVLLANTFFLINAIIGLVAAMKLLSGWWIRGAISILIVAFLCLLSASGWNALGLALLMVLGTILQYRSGLKRIPENKIA